MMQLFTPILLKEAVLLLVIFVYETAQILRNGILSLNWYVFLHEVLNERVMVLVVFSLQFDFVLNLLNSVLPLSNFFHFWRH